MHSEVTVKRAFFTRSLTIDYLLRGKLQLPEVPELYGECFELLPNEQIVRDTKGLDAGAVIHPLSTPPPQSGREELLTVRGRTDPDLKGGRAQPPLFSAAICSAFAEFSGAHHISYAVTEERGQELPAYVALKNLGRVIPLQIESFRIGLEFFGSSYITAMMGYVPEVLETMILEVAGADLALHIYCEGVSAKRIEPLKAGQTFDRLGKVLRHFFNFDLPADFQAKALAAL